LFGDKLYAGQLPINLGMIASDFFVGLLDDYPNAAAAYSLRKLRIAYTGSAIRVRRTDLQELDIGFTSLGELDTTALLAFTGTGALDNGFVTTWYDQSGNAINATQATALNQPQIVSSGSVILENGKTAIQFDGTNDNLLISSITNTSSNSLFVVDNRNRAISGTTDFLFTFVMDRIYYDKDTYFRMASNSGNYIISSMTNTTNAQEVLSLFYNSSGSIYKNSVLQDSGLNFTPLNGSDISTIGSFKNSTLFAQVKHQEIIYYTSDQSSNRTGIEDNINDFYSIY